MRSERKGTMESPGKSGGPNLRFDSTIEAAMDSVVVTTGAAAADDMARELTKEEEKGE